MKRDAGVRGMASSCGVGCAHAIAPAPAPCRTQPRLRANPSLRPPPPPVLHAPAAPASVRKQWPNATILTGSSASGTMRSMYTPPSGTSAVPVRHSGESSTA